MLKLRTASPVYSNSRPIIRPLLVPIRPLIKHWLDREYMAGLHGPRRFIGGIMWDRWICVEEPSHAVATVRFDHRIRWLMGLGYPGYRNPHIAVQRARFDLKNGLL